MKNFRKNSNYYREQHRPQFHFSPNEKWMNDPNGIVFYEGEYHLFYQYHPDDIVWGPMHWGHAVSKDMVVWQNLPIALYPDSLGHIFSGSAVVDWNNTSGLGKNGQPPLVAIFTHHLPEKEEAGRSDFQYQSIAYSNDKGRTWIKYKDNPVIKNTDKIKDFRDPKVIWNEKTEQWIMVLAAYDHIKFWSSKNLKDWKYLSDFSFEYRAYNEIWECPDFFPIKIERTNEKKWILIVSLNMGAINGGSGTMYFVGDFDGKNFLLEENFKKEIVNKNAIWLEYGRDNYAGVTWSDIPKSDGRRLFLGWMSNWQYAQEVPTKKWRGAMTLPRRLTLKKTKNSYRIFTAPVKELEKIRNDKFISINNKKIENTLKIEMSAEQFETILIFEKINLEIQLSNSKREIYRLGYNAESNQFYSDRTKAGKQDFFQEFAKIAIAPRFSNNEIVKMHIFIDRTSAELFADDGATVMTDIFFPNEDFSSIKIKSSNGATLKRGEFYNLNSIW